MKSLLLISAMLSGHLFFPGPSEGSSVDPTGTYILKGDVKKNEILGHSGELRAKLLGPKQVAVSFYISKGFPGYESGSFVDTLAFEDNIARYIPPSDRDCIILFSFGDKSVEIEQVYRDPHCSCGFGKDIMVSAFFDKRSDEPPIIQDLSAHGIGPQ
ncbi:MAG TPA: hypothetical protein VK543_00735 [Puia sp.]|nr:hypothetical protein [Puia sp.]